ncbi:MAG: hypothetical protein BWY15_02110 [Firmicutes bacterium ADurb.Bin193]|nr:MAG: hypothetical protein BWY15_02110 [Firmicutes bacterium ADurb.Bin193]
MAKRFTDTEKWRDEWWGSLNNDYRMIWLYLVDSCSIAGIWKKDFRGLNFNCNTNISESDFVKALNGRVVDKGNYFFIPKFLQFQYPKGLNSNKPAILAVVKELKQNNLIQTVNQLLGNDYLIIKDKDKVKDRDKDKGKEKEKENRAFVIVGDEEILDPMPVLETFFLQLNGMVRENNNIAWRPIVPEWFAQHIGEEFSDGQHLKNSFKRYYMSKKEGKFKNNTTQLSAEELYKQGKKS